MTDSHIEWRLFPLRFVVLAFALTPGFAWATNAGNEDRLQREAAELERKSDWRGAAEAYWKILGINRQSTHARERYLHCLRRVHLTARHADPVYRKRIHGLPFAKALNAYLDAIGKIQANYVERVSLNDLYRQGFNELTFALSDRTFRVENAADASDAEIQTFVAHMRESWADPALRDAADVRTTVREIALAAQKALGVRPSVVVMEFVCGACNALDERSGYLPPSEEYTAHLGQLNSLGLLIASTADHSLIVEKVAAGSWAAQIGLKEGDRVIPMAQQADKDEVGPLTEIGVVSRGETTRRTIKVPDNLPSIGDLDLYPGGVGYLRISSFAKSTPLELEKALGDLAGMARLDPMSGQLRALIVDLRGNPGGLFPTAVQIAERFLPEGIIVSTQSQSPAYSRAFESHSGMGANDLPLVVLIDNETASAAEVLAGALKDNQRALLIGRPSYGKGTIQTVLQLSEAGGVRLTLARFFTPRGQPYDGLGVTPHLLETMRAREVAVEQARAILAMRP